MRIAVVEDVVMEEMPAVPKMLDDLFSLCVDPLFCPPAPHQAAYRAKVAEPLHLRLCPCLLLAVGPLQ